MARWRQDSETGELIPIGDSVTENKSAYIQRDIDAFRSPIDQKVISSRSHLRVHNQQHGVTDIRDYGDHYFERKAKERHTAQTGGDWRHRQARLNDVVEAVTAYESGFKVRTRE